MIGRNGERRSGISAQAARHDDDDDIYMCFGESKILKYFGNLKEKSADADAFAVVMRDNTGL